MQVAPLSPKHLAELKLASEPALLQWAKDVRQPLEIVNAMERVLLFLRQNGGASRQARQVASVAFIIGEQVRAVASWEWMSVSEDGALNPTIVSPDGSRACLVVDAMTMLVAGELKSSLAGLVQACIDGQPHPLVVSL